MSGKRRARWSRAVRVALVVGLGLAGAAVPGSSIDAQEEESDAIAADDPALIPIAPQRFVDTREGATTVDGLFAGEGKRAADSVYEVQIAGRGGVPADAAGVVLYITAVDPDGWGFLTTDPCLTPRPWASSLNYYTGTTVGNELVSGLSTSGSLCIYTFNGTDLTVDVVGFIPPAQEERSQTRRPGTRAIGNAATPIDPARLLETREGDPTVDGISAGIGRTTPGSTTKVKVTGRAGVPAGVDAVIVNVAALSPEDAGFLLVHPCLPALPNASSVNYVPGVDRANELITPVDANGDLCIFTEHDLDLILDVVGYIPTGTTYRNLPPQRFLETRVGPPTFDGLHQGVGKRPAGSEYTLQVTGRGGVSEGATAAIANVVAVDTEGDGFVTVHPCENPRPEVASLNYAAGVNGANEIIAGLNDAGEMCLFTSAPAHLLVDVTGFFLPTILAATDTYSGIGNVLLEVGVPASGFPSIPVVGSVLDNDIGNGALAVTASDATSANGGTVTMGVNGTFTYSPPPGYTGTDTFQYTLTDGIGTSDSGKVEINLTDMVWFVDNTSAGPVKNGTSGAPFDRLADAGPPSGPGEPIFVYRGDGTDTGYDGGIVLDADQDLLGEKVGLTVGGTVLVPPGGGTPKLSASGGGDAVTMGAGSEVKSFALDISGAGAAISSAGAGGAVNDVDISANSEGIALDGATGTFTFDNVNVTSNGGASLRVTGGDATVDFTNSTITQTGAGPAIDISNHTGSLPFDVSNTLDATNGTGLQFSNADGTYTFDGTTTLNGGDAGIDIVNGSAGTFTFPETTTITNPTGPAVKIDNFDAPGDFDYDGNIVANLEVILQAFVSESGTSIDFTANGGNSLMSTGSPFGAIELFELDGDLTMTTPTTVTDPDFSALFATDGSGTWSFTDLTIVDLKDLNGGVDVFGNTGTVNFTNVNISTDSAGTTDAATGFLAGGNNIINVDGDSSVDADGGGAVVIIDANMIDITFKDLTSTNNTTTQVGFAGDDGIDLLSIDAGTFTVTGTTTVTNADGQGISIEDVGAAVTFETLALDDIGKDGVISGVAFDNPGSVTIKGGTINDTGEDGIRLGSGGFGSGVASFSISGVTFTSIGGSVANVSNSGLAGSGNTAVPFSCTDLGGNTGKILFNAGADSCPP